MLLAGDFDVRDGAGTYLIREFRHHNAGDVILHPSPLQDDHVPSVLCHPAGYGSVVMRGKNKGSIRAPSCTGYLGGIVARGLGDLWLTFVGPLGNKNKHML